MESPFSHPDCAAAPSPGLTILIAGDDPCLREALVEFLCGTGPRVLEFQSPSDALELARTHDAIDVLLTDVLMPGIRCTARSADSRRRRLLAEAFSFCVFGRTA